MYLFIFKNQFYLRKFKCIGLAERPQILLETQVRIQSHTSWTCMDLICLLCLDTNTLLKVQFMKQSHTE